MTGSTRFFIPGPAGQLQALWGSAGHPENFARAAIICHPHPLYGGTMENKVVSRIARYVSAAGIEAIRFNFRGAGQSQGSYDEGRGERDDLTAVIDFVHKTSPQAKLAIAGFSFGAWIGLAVGAQNAKVAVLAGVAPPVRMFDFKFLGLTSKPTLIVYAGNDQFTDASTMQAWLEHAPKSTESVLIPEVDHFFGPRVDEAGKDVAEFLNRSLK